MTSVVPKPHYRTELPTNYRSEDIMLNESLLAGNCRALQTVARLIVPSKKIDLVLLNGSYGRTLAFGPDHVQSSVLPG